jgi:hypothetical protein
LKKVSASSGWWWSISSPELGVQALNGLVHAQFVERDAIALGVQLPLPVGLFEARLRGPRRGAEQPVVAIEALDDRLGDRERVRVVQLVREHRGARARCQATGM